MPRAYEVAGQLIKNVADATDKLLDLQKKLKDVNKEEEVKGPSTTNNLLFVGSIARPSEDVGEYGCKKDKLKRDKMGAVPSVNIVIPQGTGFQ